MACGARAAPARESASGRGRWVRAAAEGEGRTHGGDGGREDGVVDREHPVGRDDVEARAGHLDRGRREPGALARPQVERIRVRVQRRRRGREGRADDGHRAHRDESAKPSFWPYARRRPTHSRPRPDACGAPTPRPVRGRACGGRSRVDWVGRGCGPRAAGAACGGPANVREPMMCGRSSCRWGPSGDNGGSWGRSTPFLPVCFSSAGRRLPALRVCGAVGAQVRAQGLVVGERRSSTPKHEPRRRSAAIVRGCAGGVGEGGKREGGREAGPRAGGPIGVVQPLTRRGSPCTCPRAASQLRLPSWSLAAPLSSSAPFAAPASEAATDAPKEAEKAATAVRESMAFLSTEVRVHVTPCFVVLLARVLLVPDHCGCWCHAFLRRASRACLRRSCCGVGRWRTSW